MNMKKLGDTFIEPRSERALSEVRNFQEFRTNRDVRDINEGNRRYKKFSLNKAMPALIQNRFGRQPRAHSASRSLCEIKPLKSNFVADNAFYSKLQSSFGE